MIIENPCPGFERCADWREAIETRVDETDPARESDALDRHLAKCPSCCAYEEELQALRRRLRELPGARPRPLEPEWIDRVWAQTIDAPPAPGRVAPWRRATFAAAAVLGLAVGAAWFVNRATTVPDGYSEAELVRLDRELEVALVRLGRTLRGAERIAIDEMLIGETAPVLRRVPLGHETERTSDGG